MPKRGLTGTEGVLTPNANVPHLMLRRDVIAACGAGKFFIYPVTTIDEGVQLLTGRPAGERGVTDWSKIGSMHSPAFGKASASSSLLGRVPRMSGLGIGF